MGAGAQHRFTDKQLLFIAEYVKDFNKTRAAIAAGYSERSARDIGHENLTKPNIAEEVQRIIDERCMGKDEALIRLGEHARSNIGDFWDIPENGDPVLNLASERAKKKLHLIKKLKTKTTTRTVRQDDGYADITTTETEIELYDAQAALVQIGRHHKLFTDKIEADVTGEIAFTSDEAAQAKRELDQWQTK